MSDLHVSWDDYHRLIETLALEVLESDWEFDAVVCLARGGLRVGDVLSRLFRRPLGVLFTSAYREEGGTAQGELVIGEQISSALPLPSGRWLLVDDMADTGVSLAGAVAALRDRCPEVIEIRTAVLWMKAQSRFRPDYVGRQLSGNPWIHQPFERYDSLTPAQLRQAAD